MGSPNKKEGVVVEEGGMVRGDGTRVRVPGSLRAPLVEERPRLSGRPPLGSIERHRDSVARNGPPATAGLF